MSSDHITSTQCRGKTKPLFSMDTFKNLYPLYDDKYSKGAVLDSTLPEALLSLQTYDLFRKYVPTNSSQVTCDKAIDTFLECEDTCWLTNCRILSKADYQLNYTINCARRIIKAILGSYSYNELVRSVRHSGGATVTRKRRQGHPVYKILNYEVSSSCSSLLSRVIYDLHESSSYGYSLSDLAEYTIIDYNKIATVPKSSDTDRPIGMEPSGNMFIQLGLGKMIRKRLKRFGIDLNNQETNRKMACSGSTHARYSTIDLSSASDTISYELVKELMPADWFEHLDKSRSEQSLISVSSKKGTTITLQKFSSMGNGYTFELESLIFYAITLASINENAGCDDVSIFGDDIIIKPNMYHKVSAALESCGFSVNHSKSFRLGPFKESCGGNYFRGIDITPIRIKKDIVDDMDIYWLYNSIVRQIERLQGLINHEDFHDVLRYLESLLSRRIHFAIPDGIGDGGLLIHTWFPSVSVYDTKYNKDYQCISVRARSRVAKSQVIGGLRGLLLYALSANRSLPTEFLSRDLNLPSSYEPVTQSSTEYKVKNKWIMI